MVSTSELSMLIERLHGKQAEELRKLCAWADLQMETLINNGIVIPEEYVHMFTHKFPDTPFEIMKIIADLYEENQSYKERISSVEAFTKQPEGQREIENIEV